MANQWIIRPKPLYDAEIKLLCFPYAGGGTPVYFRWKNKLCNDVELNIVQLPGRGTHLSEEPIDDMDILIEKLLPQVSDIVSGRYIVFGHSVGSRVGFELVRQAIKGGFPAPLHFFASGSSSPKSRCIEEGISELPDIEFIDRLSKMNGTPPEVLENKEFMELFLPTLRADFKISEQYVCSGNFTMPTNVTVLSGREDDIPMEQLRMWGSFCNACEVIMCDGDHFFIDYHYQQVLDIVNTKVKRELLGLIA
jgi:medium-chain acyl-[acyl-carrier-protein] hydrolase